MKTLVCVRPGHFEYRSIERPVLTTGSTIIKIKRIGVCGTDLHAFEGTQPYFEYPRILGHELAGEIVELDNAPDFQIGETVTFIPYINCGHCVACRSEKQNCCVNIRVCGVHTDGGMVEYLSVPSRLLVKGQGLSADELALVEPLAIGAHGIRRAKVVKDEFVLVVGAGPIGLGAMEFARIAGARVIAMDVNPQRLQFCHEKLGIDYSINPKTEESMAELSRITKGDMPSVVIDATGNLGAINHSFQYMAHGARYLLIGLQKGDVQFNHPEFHKREGTLMSSRNATREDFVHVISSIKKGQINPLNYITDRVPFSEVKGEFENWLKPGSGIIKAMICL